LLTTVLFVFPPEIPTTALNMNYCIVAFGVILLIAAMQWIFDGRKNFTGPKVDVNALVHGAIEGIAGDIMEVEQSGDSGSLSGKHEGLST
jgi:hypothetical protein